MKSNAAGRRAKHLELIGTVGLEISSVLDLDKLLAAATAHTTKTLGYDNCAILSVEGDELVVRAAYRYPRGLKRKALPFGTGVVGKCAERRAVVNVGDISKCSFYFPSGLKGIRSEIAVPIVYGAQLLGVLTIESVRSNAFAREDERALGVLASQLGVAMRNAKLAQATLRELRLLHSVGSKITSNIDIDALLASLTRMIGENLGYPNCAVFIPSGNKLVLRALSHFSKTVLGLEVPFGKGLVGRCARSKREVNVGDVSRCSYYIPSGLAGIRSAIALPILYRKRLVGVLTTESRERNAYDAEKVRMLRILCSQLGAAIQNAEMHEEIKRLAVRDSLTKLYNHRYFTTKIEQETLRARRYRRPLSLILVDLDNFKRVNDEFGHLKGDDVLVAVARIIMRSIRTTDSSSIMKEVEIDVPIRYGGEELMIIMPETPLEGALVAAERLRALIEADATREVGLIGKKGEPVPVTGSFGVASLAPEETAADFVKRVDEAMYEAKRSGKNRVCRAG